jgi:hypothetical protein
MILNANLILSENQAVTATALSANIIGWPDNGTPPREGGAITRNLGAGTPIPVLMQVVEDFATLTSLTITIETSDNEDMSSSTVLSSSGALVPATLVAGYRPTFTRFVPDATMLKYLALRYTVDGSNATAGKMTAALATEVST